MATYHALRQFETLRRKDVIEYSILLTSCMVNAKYTGREENLNETALKA